ncbi:MAG: molybdate ABC transporter substrate-binding protein [Verrucomicrobiaceae bacterium]|nr:molybdate ABC transporter substrate-binding protein [Verrucomicrobiaceae bacterium]
MTPRLLVTAVTLASLAACKPGAPSGSSKAPLLVHCAASLKAPVEAIVRDYEKEEGVTVRLQFGASQTLLAGVEVSKTGDLYLPADDSYLAPAKEKQLVTTTIPIATQTAVLVVKKGNAKAVKSLADLQRAEVRLAIANPDAAAIGKLLRAELGDTWKALAAKAVLTGATVTEAANAVKVDSADAAFIWDAMLPQYPDFEVVTAPECSKVKAQVAVGLLTCAPDSAAAMRFARYLAAKDKGLLVFQKQGFTVAEGEPWAREPELLLYSGSMLRPAIDKTLADFEKREGVRVTRVYNGCGILVGQMKAGSKPDAYFACDNEFMNQVQDSFESRDEIAQNELVILVPKGNPHQVADLRDLTKPGLKIGIGHEKQCAMGWLTQRTLTEGGIKDEFMKNVTVQTPTGDMLVNQMLAGSLDAAITYLSNAIGAGDKLDAVRIQGIKCAIATQPFAIAKQSPYKQTMARLHELLRSAESKERFTGEGFQWK